MGSWWKSRNAFILVLPLELPVHVVPARKISAIVKEIPVVNEMPLVSAMQSGVHEVLHRPEGVPQVIQTIHSYAMNSGLQNAPAVQKFKTTFLSEKPLSYINLYNQTGNICYV